jgi:4-hydroxy-4-methyl-2-oxoglutarate aldolase
VVSCGGCSVSPGDIILGDDDGIAVVPLGRQAQVLAAAQDKIAQEERALARLEAGESLADQLGVPEPEALE